MPGAATVLVRVLYGIVEMGLHYSYGSSWVPSAPAGLGDVLVLCTLDAHLMDLIYR